MRPPRVDEIDYLQFLIAAQKVYSCCEASRCCPDLVAHDAFVRLLARQPPDTAALWSEVAPLVRKEQGVLVLDDTTLDKPYSEKIALVTRHWSGKHHQVVQGINLLTLLWTDGDASLPCDCRLYDKPLENGKTKNEHFQDMLTIAKERGFVPSLVCFDSWYSSTTNLKLIRSFDWRFLTRLKANRLVNPDRLGNVPVNTLRPPTEGIVVHLKEFGFVRLFRIVARDSDEIEHETEHETEQPAETTETDVAPPKTGFVKYVEPIEPLKDNAQYWQYWITNDLAMTEDERQEGARQAFKIENYHRGIKQCCAVERCQCRSEIKQRAHILLSLRAFVRLEAHRLATGISWYQAKWDIIRRAIREYIAKPTICLGGFA